MVVRFPYSSAAVSACQLGRTWLGQSMYIITLSVLKGHCQNPSGQWAVMITTTASVRCVSGVTVIVGIVTLGPVHSPQFCATCKVVNNFVECAIRTIYVHLGTNRHSPQLCKLCKFCTHRNCKMYMYFCTSVLYNHAVLHSIQSWTNVHYLQLYNEHALLHNHRPLSSPFLFRTSTSITIQLARLVQPCSPPILYNRALLTAHDSHSQIWHFLLRPNFEDRTLQILIEKKQAIGFFPNIIGPEGKA